MAWHHRVLNVFRSQRVWREVDREVEFHIRERAEELIASGSPVDEAWTRARRKFGNELYRKEQVRDANIATRVESLVMDVRYGLRSLAKSPAFSAVAIISLALGIGANTAIFSLINALMLKTLPVSHPEQLVQLTVGPEADAEDMFTNPLWEAIRDRQDVFNGVFAYNDRVFDSAEGGEQRPIVGNYVSAEFFSTLGVRPAVGRLLSRTDDYRGCPGAAVLGYGMWQSRYGGDPDIVGRTISLDGRRFPIVGVTESSFFGLDVGAKVQAYIPLCAEALMNGAGSILDDRSNWWLRIIGRSADGRSEERVQARLATLAASVHQSTIPMDWQPEDQATYAARKLWSRPSANGLSYLRGEYSSALIALMVIVGLVLVIACANVANLLLARAAASQREVAVRLAIGAGHGRVARQLLTESLLLSSIGAALGILFAQWGCRVLVSFLSGTSTLVWLDLAIDRHVLGFTIAVALVTGVLFGLAPAWRSVRVQPQSVLKANSRAVVEGHSRFSIGKGLVVAQIALSLMLVTGAALLVASFRTLSTMDIGYARNTLLATMDRGAADIPEDRLRVEYQAALARVRALPGVASASISAITPVGSSSWTREIVIAGFTPATFEESLSSMNEVSDGYFATFGIPFVAGRDFGIGDVPGSPRVAIVTEAFGRHFFGTTDVVGRQFTTSNRNDVARPLRIIGVVKDTKYKDIKANPAPIAYYSRNQNAAPSAQYNFAIRAVAGDPVALIPALKELSATIDPAASLRFTTIGRQVSDALTRERLLATLSGFFGGLALLLAMIGLYGVVSYNVGRRRSEIGIRMALGSGRASVMQMVLREVGGLVIAGLLIGGIGVLAGGKLIASFLFGLQPTDIRMLALSALTLSAVAIGAGALPAWRAGRVDPMRALREE